MYRDESLWIDVKELFGFVVRLNLDVLVFCIFLLDSNPGSLDLW